MHHFLYQKMQTCSEIEKFIQRNAKTDICRSWRFLIRDLFYSPQKSSLPIVQALAPCRLVGCCVVIGLVPHTLLIDTKNIKFTKLYTKLELNSILRNV